MPQTNGLSARPFAVVTGVSRRIGFALAEHCAAAGFDLLVAAPDDCVDAAAARLRRGGGLVEAVRADLGDPDGVDELCDILTVLGRPVEALVIGPAAPRAAAPFLDQAPGAVADAVDLAVLGPVRLAHAIGRDMRERGRGRILFACAPPVTGAAHGASPNPAITSGANAFLAGFALALRQELDGSGVTVTCLPAPVRGAAASPAEGAAEARARAFAAPGFEAMMRGEPGLPPHLAEALRNPRP